MVCPKQSNTVGVELVAYSEVTGLLGNFLGVPLDFLVGVDGEKA